MHQCVLCSTELSRHPICDGVNRFCCTGCHAVFNILSAKNQLSNFQEHPIFKQALSSGLISNPRLLEKIQQARPSVPEKEIEKLYIEIQEMWCPACSELIKLLLGQEKGVYRCIVDYSTDLASIEYAPRYISKEKITELIRSFGYTPLSLESTHQSTGRRSLYFRFIIAAFFSLNIMMFSYPIYAAYFDYDEQKLGALFAWLSFYAAIPVVFYSGWPILHRFWNGLKLGFFGMETLVILGVATAFGLSVHELFNHGIRVYFDSLTVIITFVLLGKIIESKAKFSAKEAILRLVRAIPKRGRKKMADGKSLFVPIKEISVGDLLIVYAGEKIVLDGIVVTGEGICDESLMTGESIPLAKQIGNKVLGGSILVNGTIECRVTNTIEESALGRIVETIQKEIGHKTVYIRAIDQIIKWFVPIVIALSLCTGVAAFLLGATAENSLLQAISVLLISCPCAIGIAAPLAESHVINQLASLGAIVRNRGALSLLGKETVMIFDKTGTITEGKFKVLGGLEKLSAKELCILKEITARSIHPIALSTNAAIEAEKIVLEQIEEVIGKGVTALFEGDRYYFGSAPFLEMNGIKVKQEETIHTVVYFANGKKCLAAIVLGDRLRQDSEGIIDALKPVKTVLLSGDGENAVAAVAKQCGFSEWHSRCNPLQKKEIVEMYRKQGHFVCMVGDGINDAPALTAAHIGVSVVSATDISIQVSDLLLTTDRLSVILQIRKLAVKGREIVYQNLFWAFFYNVIGIGLAMANYLSPIFAAFAMVASSLMVLFNARRLKHR